LVVLAALTSLWEFALPALRLCAFALNSDCVDSAKPRLVNNFFTNA
jgi:hypothetical protein